MRELALTELELVSGGQEGLPTEEAPSVQDKVTVTGVPTESDPWVISISMDSILDSGMSVAEYIFGPGGYENLLGDLSEAAQDAIDAAQAYLDEAQELNCQQHSANIAAAEASVEESIRQHDEAMNQIDPSYDGDLSLNDSVAIIGGVHGEGPDGADVANLMILNGNIVNAEADLDDAIAASEADGC